MFSFLRLFIDSLKIYVRMFDNGILYTVGPRSLSTGTQVFFVGRHRVLVEFDGKIFVSENGGPFEAIKSSYDDKKLELAIRQIKADWNLS
jgi:hypothetical protein